MILEASHDVETDDREFLQRHKKQDKSGGAGAALAGGLILWATLLFIGCPAPLHFSPAPIHAQK